LTADEIARRAQAGGAIAQAFVHPSYAHEHGVEDNQRLEFLGDAVLQMTVSEILYRRFPRLDPAQLTRFRITLVRQEALARRGRALALGEVLRTGRGKDQGALSGRESVLCDTFEALLAGIFLEDGLEAARAFVEENVEAELAALGAAPWVVDAKTALQRPLERKGRRPQYRVLERRGPDHRPVFTVGVYDGERELARAEGPSKQAAEEAAARRALDALGIAGEEPG